MSDIWKGALMASTKLTTAALFKGSPWDAAVRGGGGPVLDLLFTSGTLDPRVTFSRASLATMFDNTGRLTYAPNNLVTRSNDIDHSDWFKAAATVSGNLITPTTANASHNTRQNNLLPAGANGYFVIEAKPEGYAQIGLREASATGSCAAFTLSGAGTVNGTYTVGNATASNAAITALEDGWYRISFKVAGTSSLYGFGIYVLDGTWVSGDVEALTFAGDGTSGIRVRHAQAEAVTYETAPRAYNATGASAYHGPRFDQDPAALTVLNSTELLANTAFNDATGLTNINADVTGGQLRLGISGAGSGSSTQNVSMTAGRPYLVSYDIVSAATNVRVDSGASFTQSYSSTPGRRTEVITPSATVTSIRLVSQGVGLVVIDNFSVQAYDAEPLGLLIEEARTNQALHSQNFADASWQVYNGATKIGDAPVADPAGGYNAHEVNVGSVGSLPASAIYRSAQHPVTGSYTVSCWVRAKTGTSQFRFQGTSQMGTETYSPDLTATTTWQRFSFTFTFSGATGSSNTSLRAASPGGTVPNIYVFGFQLEAGAKATSYIPTTSATVTRAADSASMTGTNFSDWYNQDEGTFVVEFSAEDQRRVISTYDGSNVRGVDIYANAGGLAVFSNHTGHSGLIAGPYTPGATAKVAYAYKANDVAVSLNGGAVEIDASVTIDVVPTLLTLGSYPAGSNIINGHIKSLSYYATRKAELQALSA